MTVAMQQDFRGAGAQWQIELGREFLEQVAGVGHNSSLFLQVASEERRRVVFHRGKTTGFAEKNVFTSAGDRKQRFHYRSGVRASFLQQSLRDKRTATTPRSHYAHAASTALQDFKRSHTDLRLVVIGERVVEQSNA